MKPKKSKKHTVPQGAIVTVGILVAVLLAIIIFLLTRGAPPQSTEIFRGPSGTPHVQGPSGPPPNY